MQNPQSSFSISNPDIALVESFMLEKLSSEAPVLSDIARYLLKLGGKRIRPLLALTSAQLFSMTTPSPELIKVAAGIELIHMATLLHDDIIDRSPTRRASLSAYSKWGIDPTLLAGDFLLVKAFGICAELDQFIVKKTEYACIELTEGEVLEGAISAEREPSLTDYLNIISKKTASLFALSAAVGSHLAEAGPEARSNMETFGRYAGIAFQMIDDILDVVADETLLGKPVGTDLRQKTPTLINLLWLEQSPASARAFFALEAPSTRECQQALEEIRQGSVVARAREVASEYAEKARASLFSTSHPLLVTSVQDNLSNLLTYTLLRCL